MKRLLTMFVVVGVAAGSLVSAQASPSEPWRWAPPGEATIYPGVQTVTSGYQCTANFVFADARSVYLGQAAHCSGGYLRAGGPCGQGGGWQVGEPVQIQGASRPGRIVYHSWSTMGQVRETDDLTCSHNDFALVRIDPADVNKVNPSVPFWGGPVAGDAVSSVGDLVYNYGSSRWRGGENALSPKVGVNTGAVHYAVNDVTGWGPGQNEWGYQVHTVTPGLDGDSASAVLDASGRALGLLTSWSTDGSYGVSDLGEVMQYMRDHTKLDAVRLVPGTKGFSPAR